ncbi:MAG: DUF1800 family protein [Burkholderiales bacterium]
MQDDTPTHDTPTHADTVTMLPAHVLPPAHLPAEVQAHLLADLQGELQGGLRFAALSAAAATALFLEACGGGSSSSDSSGSTPTATQQTAAQSLSADYAAARFLQHAQFSSSQADIDAVKAKGRAAWLDEQIAAAPGQKGWDWLAERGYAVIDANQFYQMDYQANFMAWQQILSQPDGVRRRCALALSEFFVASISGVSTLQWAQFAVAAYWDLLTENAFGNYRSLLERITLSVAMGEFLNTLGNQKEDAATGRLPDENYAREVMQLFTIGLVQLNLDGTPKLGADGASIETYTQSDVSNLARVFTGYQADESDGMTNTAVAPTYRLKLVGYTKRPMVLNASRHSMLEASFLNVTVPAGTEGKAALKIALDALFNHSNVGPFFGRQMIQRLVCSDPSPAYVARVAAAFNDNGKGVRGDLGAVFRAVLLDDEANSTTGLTSPTFGKLREPMVRVAQWARTFRANSLKGSWKLGKFDFSAVDALGQSPLQAPSVFNFFRPGYIPPGTAMAASKSTVPEFQLINESTTASWVNFMQNIVRSGMWVRAPELITSPDAATPTDGYDIVPDYSAELALVGNPDVLVARLNLLLCAGQLSGATVSMIVAALGTDKTTTTSTDNSKRSYVAKAIMFVMCCPEYLVQK